MKSLYLSFCTVLCLMVAPNLTAQVTCDSVGVIIDDNLDAYTEGALGPQADHWTTWSGTEGGDEDGTIVAGIFNSEPNALNIQGDAGGGPQDVLLLLGDKTEGAYILQWEMFIPLGVGAYYNIQHSEEPGVEWANQIDFGTDGTAVLDAGVPAARTFSYTQDDWFEVKYIIDLDNDVTYLYVDGKFIYSWPFSWQDDAMTGTKMLGAVDFYPRNETHFYYVDDIYYAEIPVPAQGQYCHLAIPIDAGTHTVIDLDCFGAGFTIRAAGQGRAGAWYSYTAPEDGIISLSSCGNGNDSRVWIFSGGCENLTRAGVNDDYCGISEPGASEWASFREVLVTGGETYLICWDDIWDSGGFDFTLEFRTDAPVPGNFCETAIDIEPGIHTIDQINGNAAVAGPNINHTGASTTNYAQSEWYAFTPPQSGTMTVSSCDMSSEETRLWIYTGDCGIDNLQLVANNDDGCDIQSLVADLAVEGGTNYYIEWDSETLDAPGFDWELFYEPAVDVTEAEFVSAFSVSPNPASNQTFLNYKLSGATDLTLRIFNNIGQQVQAFQLPKAQAGNELLDLSGLPSGLYFVVVTDEKNLVTKQIVVE